VGVERKDGVFVSIHGKLGLGLIVFALLLFFVLIPNYVIESSVLTYQGIQGALSARLFPSILSVSIGLMGVLLVLLDLRAKAVGELNSIRKPILEKEAILRVGILFGLMLVYYFLTLWVGYVLATAIMLPAVMWHYGCRDRKALAMTAVIFPIIIHVVFIRFMHVLLPQGALL
jgi:hypothetical protein